MFAAQLHPDVKGSMAPPTGDLVFGGHDKPMINLSRCLSLKIVFTKECTESSESFLVGGFNPSEKY